MATTATTRMTTGMNVERAPLSRIAQALHDHQRFVLISHVRPDGDALGCTVGLALSLRAAGKEVAVWNEDGPLEKLAFLPGSELVTRPPAEPQEWEVVLALDTAAHERLGAACLAAIAGKPLWINIDHHVSNNGYGDLAHIAPEAPATGQIIYELICQARLPLDAAIAANLYAAISTDTGSFQYSNTTARTLEIAAALIHAGVEVGQISEKLYHTYPQRRLELLSALLNTLQITCEGRVACFSLTRETAQRLGTGPEDNEGLIDFIRGIDTVAIAIFFEEIGEGKARVSMRAKDPRYDVCAVCAEFGGGGHTLAAGARVSGEFATARQAVLDAACAAVHRIPLS